MASESQAIVLVDHINITSNLSTEVHPHDSPIWIFAAPLLIIIGCVENILALIILSRPQFNSLPSRITLISLAVIDSLVLFFGLIRFWINVVFETQPTEWGDLWCKAISWIVITLSHLSSCLVALLSVERLFAVRLPHHQFKPSIDLGGSVILIVLCCAINSIHFKLTRLVENLPPDLDNTTIPTPGIHTKLHTYVCTNGTTEIALLVDILDMLLLFILPFLIIVLCNSYIIFKLKKRLENVRRSRYRVIKGDDKLYSKNHSQNDVGQPIQECTTTTATTTTTTEPKSSILPKRSQSSSPTSNENLVRLKLDRSYSERRQIRITTTLLLVTFAFLLCNFPFCIIHILRTADESRQNPTWNMAWLFSYLLVYVNNCMNFPIYMISQPPFRSELKHLFGLYKRQ